MLPVDTIPGSVGSYETLPPALRGKKMREGRELAEYEYVGKPGTPPPPLEEKVTVQLRNPETMELFYATVIIHSASEGPVEGDILYFTAATTGRDSTPHSLEIFEIKKEEEEEVKALPRQKLSLGQRKGRMLMDMIKERGEKKK
jgi:hypothetical protein